jgi:hypothetical protein
MSAFTHSTHSLCVLKYMTITISLHRRWQLQSRGRRAQRLARQPQHLVLQQVHADHGTRSCVRGCVLVMLGMRIIARTAYCMLLGMYVRHSFPLRMFFCAQFDRRAIVLTLLLERCLAGEQRDLRAVHGGAAEGLRQAVQPLLPRGDLLLRARLR